MESCGLKVVGQSPVCNNDCQMCEYKVIGSETVYQNGCFTREKYWFHGYVRRLPGLVTYTNGWSGPETILVVEKIRPCCVFSITP